MKIRRKLYTNNMIYKIVPYIVLLVVICLSVGYSAFCSKLSISKTVTQVRLKENIRITNLSLDSVNNSGVSKYNEYNKENITAGVYLPEDNSTVTYKVEVTNFGNMEMGILDITGLPNNLEYEITDYELGTKICDSTNTCKLGISKEFNITIKYKANSNNSTTPGYESDNLYDLNLKFDFRQAYNVTYEGITVNNYPTSVLKGDTLEVNFISPIPKKVVPYTNNTKVSNYTYSNNKITVENVSNDIKLKYKDKVYLTTLPQSTYFKTSDYLTKVKTVSFIDNMDIPSSGVLVTYNLEENNGAEIKGWIDSNYNLYIGSEWDIYSKDLSRAFQDMTGVTSIKFDNLNTSENTTFYYSFKGMSNLESIDVSSFDTRNATNMSYMFHTCSKLKTLDLSNFNTSKVNYIQYMFANMSELATLNIKSFNTSKVTNMSALFKSCSKLTTLDLSHFNTSQVTQMSDMFNGCSGLTSLNISSFNTSKVKGFGYMFSGCTKLSTINVSNFNTSSATSMSGMFAGNVNLTSLDVSNFNTSNVKTMDYMFQNTKKITTLDLSNFNTSNITAMNNMFAAMNNVTSLDLSSFNTTNVTNMSGMFAETWKLSTLDLSDFNTSKVTNMQAMFRNSHILDYIYLNNADFSKVTSYANMFASTSFGTSSVPITIVVKDQASKDFIQARLNDASIAGNVNISTN